MDKYDIKNTRFVCDEKDAGRYGFYLGNAEITEEGRLRFSDVVMERIVYNKLLDINQIDGYIDVVCVKERIYGDDKWSEFVTKLKEQLDLSTENGVKLFRYFTRWAINTSINNQIIDMTLDEVRNYYDNGAEDNKLFNVFALSDEDKNVEKGMLIIRPADGQLTSDVEKE